jgi:hypothetical protein
MRGKIGWIVAVLMVFGGSVGTPGLTAQPIEDCGKSDLGPQGQHSFGAGGFDVTCSSWELACEDKCHTEPVDGHCTSTHYEYCGEEEEDNALFVALRDGDRAAIRKAVLAAYEAGLRPVRVVPERRVLQVEDCVGLVVAQVPLPAKPEPRLRLR